MKKLVVMASALLVSAAMFAQGTASETKKATPAPVAKATPVTQTAVQSKQGTTVQSKPGSAVQAKPVATEPAPVGEKKAAETKPTQSATPARMQAGPKKVTSAQPAGKVKSVKKEEETKK